MNSHSCSEIIIPISGSNDQTHYTPISTDSGSPKAFPAGDFEPMPWVFVRGWYLDFDDGLWMLCASCCGRYYGYFRDLGSAITAALKLPPGDSERSIARIARNDFTDSDFPVRGAV
jgi:hypothetical protein